VPEKDYPGERGHHVGQELDVFGDDLFILGGEPGEVPAGMREARRETEPDRVGQEDGADNRDAAGGLLDSPECGGPGRDDHVHLEPDEVSGELRMAIGLPFGPAVLDAEVLPFDPPQVAEALPKRLDERGRELRVCVADEADTRRSPPHRLRLGGERRCEHAQRKHDENSNDTTPHGRLLTSTSC
jgi:hypothetical protein